MTKSKQYKTKNNNELTVVKEHKNGQTKEYLLMT